MEGNSELIRDNWLKNVAIPHLILIILNVYLNTIYILLISYTIYKLVIKNLLTLRFRIGYNNIIIGYNDGSISPLTPHTQCGRKRGIFYGLQLLDPAWTPSMWKIRARQNSPLH